MLFSSKETSKNGNVSKKKLIKKNIRKCIRLLRRILIIKWKGKKEDNGKRITEMLSELITKKKKKVELKM